MSGGGDGAPSDAVPGDAVLGDAVPPAVVYVTATPPWPTTSGGRARTAATVAALARIAPTHLVILPPGPVIVTPPASVVVASVTVQPVGRPGRIRRLVHRALALAAREHPYARRWRVSGGPDRLRAVVDTIGPGTVILEYPFYPVAARGLRAPGRTIVADVGDDRIAVARQVARLGSTRRARWLARLDLVSLARSETELDGLDQVWFAAVGEARAAAADHPALSVHTIPNVVDVERLATARSQARPDPRSAAFLGSFDYPPNEVAAIRFADRIVPRLRATAGTERIGRLALIGRSPTPGVRNASARAGIELLGDVADAAAALAGFGVLVVPLETGSGSRLKILEACALGVPVASTSIGASGLDLEHERDILIADTDDGLAAAVIRLWDEPGLNARLSDAARATVERDYSPVALEEALRRALAGLGPDGRLGTPGSGAPLGPS